jgi:hypothetical protein
MLRRQFFRSTIGAVVGAVCAPFVGKAGGEKYGTPGIQVVDIPDFQPSDFGEPELCDHQKEIIAYLQDHHNRMIQKHVEWVEAEYDRLFFYGDGR